MKHHLEIYRAEAVKDGLLDDVTSILSECLTRERCPVRYVALGGRQVVITESFPPERVEFVAIYRDSYFTKSICDSKPHVILLLIKERLEKQMKSVYWDKREVLEAQGLAL